MNTQLENDLKEVLLKLGQEKINAAHDRLVIADLINRLESISPDEVKRLYDSGFLDLHPSTLTYSATSLIKEGLELMSSVESMSETKSFMDRTLRGES